MYGYMGRILRIDLLHKVVSTLDTSAYAAWGGGHGLGSAIFFDLAKDKTVGGYDPGNIITIMTSPLSGTLAPAVSGRTEMQGIGLQSYPYPWFTRGNVGGRFSGMLKYAGWDGIVIEGAADKPVWVDIRNDEVSIRDAARLWGKDTWQTQEEIWQLVSERERNGKDRSAKPAGAEGATQLPAVMAIGPAGENRSRIAAVIHDAGNAVGQGGFGGVWGAKNLKAISVFGTKSVEVADPRELMNARLWAKREYAFRFDQLKPQVGSFGFSQSPAGAYRGPSYGRSRPSGCLGCHFSCRRRTEFGANESSCVDYGWYQIHDMNKHGKVTAATPRAADLIQRAGINCIELDYMVNWMRSLNKQGILGSGKQINTDLPFDTIGEVGFLENLLDLIEKRKGIGAHLHEGVARTAVEWGRLGEDLQSGLLALQYWGYPQHYDARVEVEWGYGSIMGDRDINEHDFNISCYWTPSMAAITGQPPLVSAQELAEIIAEKCAPFHDPRMVDYSDEGIYSASMAKTVAWHRHYTRFWKQSIGYCDWAYADFVNPRRLDKRGLTPEGEPRFFNAVTGRQLSFSAGMEIGRRIWNLDRAIWILQGRHRDQEVFPAYTYDMPAMPSEAAAGLPMIMPAYENREWKYKNVTGRKLDRTRVEEWKTRYYQLEGWDPKTGWPTRRTLEDLDLGSVADELERQGKLGG